MAGPEESRSRLETAVGDVVDVPEDEDFQAALRGQVKKAPAANPELASEIMAMLNTSSIVTESGSQIVSESHIGGDNVQISNARDVDIRHRG
ncbi:hypothetical protein AB0F88_21640 [Streptosporangium sp. NPDC023963]|uniref:hypothetical protein n=1 Tax=Streptosporangium sp. NPDC023963 TaxID=3155608 RepID=UPI00342B9495